MNRYKEKVIIGSAKTMIDAYKQTFRVHQLWATLKAPFQMVAWDYHSLDRFRECGCLTMIRGGLTVFAFGRDGEPDLELTELIRSDERIPPFLPKGVFDTDFPVEIEHIPLFAAWQINVRLHWTGKLALSNVKPSDEEVEQVRLAILDEVASREKKQL